MKFRKALALILTISLMSLFAVGCGQGTSSSSTDTGSNSAQNQEPIKIRLGHVCQTEHPYHYASQHFADLVKEKSNGRIEITIYPAAQLGGDRDMTEQVQNGTLDMGLITASVIGGFNPLLDATQLPFLIDSYDTLDKAIPTKESDALLAGLDDMGVKGLAIVDSGLRYVVMKDAPIKSMADLKGKKIRVSEAPVLLDIFKAMGASPTPMPYGEIYSGLQTGVLDGIEMDLTALVVEKHYEVAKYVTETGHYTWPVALIMNLDAWNQLSPEDQKIMQEAATETVAFNHQNVRELDEKSIKFLKENGMEFNKIDDMTPFFESTRGVVDKYSNKDPRMKAFVDMVEGVK